MTTFRVPVRVSVAPVQTYRRVVTVEASSRVEAAKIVKRAIGDHINRPGWRATSGRMETTRPDLTTYDTYLDEESLAEWAGVKEVNIHMEPRP